MIKLSGNTKLYGLIGLPTAHSMSPMMYNYCFQQDGIDAVYLAFDVPESRVPEAIDGIRSLGIRGCNVTMPNKNAVVTLMDSLSPAAALTGAVNTIVNDGKHLTGYNTDGEGMVNALAAHGMAVNNADIVLMGAGGTAASIAAQCLLDGAKSITIFNRDENKASDLIQKLSVQQGCCQLEAFSLQAIKTHAERVRNADILINATSVGMMPDPDKSIIEDISLFRNGMAVADAVYHPRKTALLKAAESVGCLIIPGLEMLLYQGAAAYRLYTGLEMPVSAVRQLFNQ